MRKTNWLPVGCALGLLLILSACFGAYVIWVQLQFEADRVPTIDFDSALWKSKKPFEHNRTVRSQMIDDLLSTHNFAGWERHELEALLGPPDKSNPEDWDVGYLLGADRSFGIDFEVLVFRFDDSARVTEFRLVKY
jgi:hypothetical protein